MKKFAFGTLFLGVAVLSACGNGGSSDSDVAGGEQELADELYFFNWGHNIDEQILADFEEEFGVEVIYDTYASNEEMLTQINSGAISYDIIIPTDYFIDRMIQMDLLAELNMENIPNFENIAEEFQDLEFDPENRYSVPYLYGSTGLAYNTEVFEEPPTSWEVLWDPEYAGKVTAHDTSRDFVSLALQRLGKSINDLDDASLEEAQGILGDLNDNVLKYTTQPAAELISGQTVASLAYSDQAGIAMAENDAIAYVLPEEDGGMLWMDNFAIPSNANSQYTAEVFINFMLGAEVSKMLTDYIPSSNPNAAARELMSEEELSNQASYPEIPDSSEYYVDPTQDETRAINRIWNEVRAQ
ncbi:hypothetical protein DH09_17905 [Bacillaceae bacterium JMAK1]|nr:hypothetical protein DH09_17905 [Bacillaceae bacterium JMAK1]